MRWGLFTLAGAMVLAACAEPAPNPYPEVARASFDQSCPPESAVCACTWDQITRALSYDEYEAALSRFRETGQMEPKVTRARTQCLEQNDS